MAPKTKGSFASRLNNRSNVNKRSKSIAYHLVSFPRGRGELRDSGPTGCEGDYLPLCIICFAEQLNSSVSNMTMESIGNNAIFQYHVTQRLRDSYSRIGIDALKVCSNLMSLGLESVSYPNAYGSGRKFEDMK